MSAAHTPGPLHVKQMAAYLDQFELRGPVDSGVIVARTVPWGNAADVEDASEANARRLAACWNVCEGVPVEALEEVAPLATIFEGVKVAAELMDQQRMHMAADMRRMKVLLDALKLAEAYIESHVAGTGGIGELIVLQAVRLALQMTA